MNYGKKSTAKKRTALISRSSMMGYIKKHDFKVFGWYRIALGILVLGYFIGKTLLGCK